TALANHSITQEAVDDSVRRILRTIIRVGLLDGPITPDHSKVNSAEHDAVALKVATEGIVLLKNDHNLLPLDAKKIKSIAIIGNAGHKLQVGALGSPQVHPAKTTEVLDAIQSRVGANVAVNFVGGGGGGDIIPASAVTLPDNASVHGFRAEYFRNADLS